jgi:hypothetical protein
MHISVSVTITRTLVRGYRILQDAHNFTLRENFSIAKAK